MTKWATAQAMVVLEVSTGLAMAREVAVTRALVLNSGLDNIYGRLLPLSTWPGTAISENRWMRRCASPRLKGALSRCGIGAIHWGT